MLKCPQCQHEGAPDKEYVPPDLSGPHWLTSPGEWVPPVDLRESESEVTVSVEVPGVKAEHLEVALTGERLRGALEELRREEVVRVVLRGELLRVASRLDGFSIALARAAAVSSLDEALKLDHDIRESEAAIEADAEIATLLGPCK